MGLFGKKPQPGSKDYYARELRRAGFKKFPASIEGDKVVILVKAGDWQIARLFFKATDFKARGCGKRFNPFHPERGEYYPGAYLIQDSRYDASFLVNKLKPSQLVRFALYEEELLKSDKKNESFFKKTTEAFKESEVSVYNLVLDLEGKEIRLEPTEKVSF